MVSTIVYAQGNKDIVDVANNFDWSILTIVTAILLVLSVAGIIYLLLRSRNLSQRNEILVEQLNEAKSDIKVLKQSKIEASNEFESLKEEFEKTTQRLLNLSLKEPPKSDKQENVQNESISSIVDAVYYANYKPQDGNFGKFIEENDGYSIWKITQKTPDSAEYVLADIDPYRYMEKWFDIENIINCEVPPTGTIISGETIRKGILIKNSNGRWIVDNKVEIKFVCK